jgi:membrane-associated phospholipid phosphatase
VTGGLLAFLARDLRQSLTDGVARTPQIPPEGIAWLRTWALCCGVAALTLYLACGYHAGFLRINAWAAEAPPWVWQWLTALGDERVPFALSLLLARRYPQVFWALVVAGLAGTALTHVAKPLFDTLRPPAVFDPETFNLIGPMVRRVSFPSGHSATAGVFFGVLACYARSASIRVGLTGLALLVGLSRVAVGVHWPVDVAAGLMGGVLAAWIGVRLAGRARWGAFDPGCHLAFVALAVLLAVSLSYWDGGYVLAAGLLRALCLLGLGYVTLAYLVLPLGRHLRAA